MTKREVLERNGIKRPVRTIKAASEAGIGLPLACAILEQESDGGWNVFGHDPTIFTGAGVVTKDKYLEYKKARIASGNRLMQGVGPVQLTWWQFQDQADRLGGCWNPYFNMLVGFRLLAEYRESMSLREAVARYNGSGPTDSYANSVMLRVAKWRKLLKGAE